MSGDSVKDPIVFPCNKLYSLVMSNKEEEIKNLVKPYLNKYISLLINAKIRGGNEEDPKNEVVNDYKVAHPDRLLSFKKNLVFRDSVYFVGKLKGFGKYIGSYDTTVHTTSLGFMFDMLYDKDGNEKIEIIPAGSRLSLGFKAYSDKEDEIKKDHNFMVNFLIVSESSDLEPQFRGILSPRRLSPRRSPVVRYLPRRSPLRSMMARRSPVHRRIHSLRRSPVFYF
jgi:hypothetical protein